MTITVRPRRQEYTGDGVTTEFTVPFQFFDLEVYVDGSLKTAGVEYWTTGGDGNEGTVVFDTPVSNAAPIIIVGDTARTQSTDYVDNDDFPASVLEAGLDRLTMIAQELDELFARSVRAPVTASSASELDFSANPNTVIRVNDVGELELITEQFLASTIINSTIDVIEAARDAAIAAKTSAETAEVNAEAAETAAETAEEIAGLAQAASEIARDEAIAAKTAAETAEENAELAQAAAEAAQDAAIISEMNAADSEIAAAASASAAAASALAASGSASSASTSATNAGLAQSASESARDASVAAKTAAETAETNAETAETNAEAARDAAIAAQAAAEAAVGSINMPVIGAGDSGKSVVANATEDGYELKDTTNERTFDIVVQFDGGASAITTGVKGYLPVDFNGTILAWTLVGDQTGSMVVDVWKDVYANYPPAVADTITASAKPTITAALKGQSSSLTGWTTSFSAGDVFGFNIDSNSSIKFATLTLKVRKS